MKVLGIVCSPRLHGNTEILIEEALKSAEEAGAETELFKVAGKTMYPCHACDYCLEAGECKIDDDMQPLYARMLEADGIIFGTPVYMWNVSAQAKITIDRTYAFGKGSRLRGKIGGVVVAAGRVGSTSACSVFHNYFNMHRMICAGDAICFGLHKGEVRQDKRGMAEAKALGKVVVRYIKAFNRSYLDKDPKKHSSSKEPPL